MGPGREFDLIRALVGESDALGAAVLVGPGDDAAVLQVGRLVVSTDLSVEDVHFRRSWISLEEVGFRAVMAAASDLAAMAAKPVGVLLSVAVATNEAEAVLGKLGDGVRGALADLGVGLVGGDLTASPGPLVLDVTVLGEAIEPVTRRGAVPEDEIWVTGVLGGSSGAVHAWSEGREPERGLREAFARPVARTREALWLVEHGDLHAMIDLSDGLAGDVGHLAAASGVRIEIEPDLIPVHPGLGGNGLELALSGGEDYELCLVSAPGVLGPLVEAFQEEFETTLTQVGRVMEGGGVHIEGFDSRDGVVSARGFDHFAPGPTAC
jgi:thiamine-monophosphate kinase